ncbi:MAG: DedA family protein [Gammaproteobacteria bacterium]|jgi:membrane protein YqaA with SNARE-associated domain|nr:DedA family protein [Gammaproteobacteria bacterium]
MQLFTPLYDKCMGWARHRYAVWYLSGLSFAESSFFPVPPDVMLAPMSMAQPARAWRYAAITTLASVLGGLLGYFIGFFAFDLIQPWLQESHYWDKYLHARNWFETWGFWAILVAGFSPIPYKVFTIAAGTLAMTMPLFVIGSILGRGGRFFLVAGLMAWGGPGMEQKLRIYVERLGWLVIVLAVVAFLYFR